MQKDEVEIVLAGESSILIYFDCPNKRKTHGTDPDLIKIIANAAQVLKTQLGDLLINLTPSYTSLLMHYNLSLINHQQFCQKVRTYLAVATDGERQIQSRLIKIPVYYGFETGLDLERLLTEKNLDLDAFIELHSLTEYLVYAIGFSPVFAFLAKVDIRIQAPRLKTPRIEVLAGSVGIADNQTAVYPLKSSGGWNIIGRTPLDLSLNNPKNLTKFSIGDRVKFHSITREQYLESGGEL